MYFDFNSCWLKIQNDNVKALEELFNEVNKPLCVYSFSITKDLFASQEIIQDLFLKIWQNRKNISIEGSLKAYMYQTAYHLSINYLIRNKTLKLSVNKLLPADMWLNLKDQIQVNEYVVEKLEAEETSKVIDKAIAELPEQCRNIFALSRIEGKSSNEIAAILNISVNTVRTQVYRALEKIKTALEK
ncbi:MAG TPA: RNA polymerase sigma-70 factor [Bacteroidales bacterium]|nr:RNA polymerase sigma-70 factor [Bacteroidales bacterium]